MENRDRTTGNAESEILPARDDEAAIAATGGDAALAQELLATLISNLPGDVTRLRRLLKARDWTGIDDAVHRIRGATAYCAVSALDAALRDLSLAAKDGEERPIVEAAYRVEREVERLSEEVGPVGLEPSAAASDDVLGNPECGLGQPPDRE